MFTGFDGEDHPNQRVNAGGVGQGQSERETIRRITPAGVVTTLAEQVGSNGNADGTGSMARFGYPTSVAVDNAGNVYVVNNGNSTVLKGAPAATTR